MEVASTDASGDGAKLWRVQFFPRDEDKTAVRLFKAHGAEIVREMRRVLDTRPLTLVHGDIRCEAKPRILVYHAVASDKYD